MSKALLALDRPTAPFTIRPATEGADLVAEWRRPASDQGQNFGGDGVSVRIR